MTIYLARSATGIRVTAKDWGEKLTESWKKNDRETRAVSGTEAFACAFNLQRDALDFQRHVPRGSEPVQIGPGLPRRRHASR